MAPTKVQLIVVTLIESKKKDLPMVQKAIEKRVFTKSTSAETMTATLQSLKHWDEDAIFFDGASFFKELADQQKETFWRYDDNDDDEDLGEEDDLRSQLTGLHTAGLVEDMGHACHEVWYRLLLTVPGRCECVRSARALNYSWLFNFTERTHAFVRRHKGPHACVVSRLTQVHDCAAGVVAGLAALGERSQHSEGQGGSAPSRVAAGARQRQTR